MFRATNPAFLAMLFAVCCHNLAVARLHAAAPDVKAIFPAGAQQGRTIELTATGTLQPWPVRADVTGTGVRFEPTKTEGKYSVVVEATATPGTRWVRFINEEGVTAARPFVIGTRAEVSESEPNDELTQAVKLDAGSKVVNGVLVKGEKAGDVDTFRLPLKKGMTLVAALEANRTLGAPIDAVLQIVSASGFVLAQNHDEFGLDPRIVFTAPQDADYFVRLFAFVSVPNSSIRYAGDPAAVYRLTLTTGPYVDFAFPPVVRIGAASDVKLHGWNLGGEITFTVPPIKVTDSTIVAPPLPEPGRAELLAVDVPLGVEQDSSGTTSPQSITAPIVVAGRIDRPNDRDVYALKVVKGQSLHIRVMSQALGFPVDPLLRIESTDGTQLLRSDDNKRGESDVDALYYVPADGEIRLIVEDLFGAGGERFVYLLDVRTVKPDFSLSLAAAELFAQVGTPLEIPIVVERSGEMTSDIEIRLEGVPAEFGDVAAVSTAKGESAKKVTLKLTPTKTFEGFVKVVGTEKPAPLKPDAKKPEPIKSEPSKPEPPLRRTAVAKIAAVANASVEEALLVVVPAKKK
ncbi:MAG: PPC domain-containing protein [Planctomycetia bacterium]|nr:PPC domain-containing protein [Planctomycetia bacterium]